MKLSLQAFERLHVSEEQSINKSFWTKVVSLSFDNYQEHINFSTWICIQVLTVVQTNVKYFLHFSLKRKLIHSAQKKTFHSPKDNKKVGNRLFSSPSTASSSFRSECICFNAKFILRLFLSLYQHYYENHTQSVCGTKKGKVMQEMNAMKC